MQVQVLACRPDQRNVPIGQLHWEVQDFATNKVLEQGSTDLLLGSVEAKSQNGVWSLKTIPLNDRYFIGMGEFNSYDFGLISDRRDVPTFSWEWFEVSGSGTASRNAAQPEIQFSTRHVGTRVEITEMTFLADVDIRVASKAKGVLADPTWRVIIRKGSAIRWPTVVGGFIEAS